MPAYLYVCPCGEELDVIHSITQNPDIECSNCGGYMFRKPQGAFTQFKGQGFYSTDKDKK